MARDRITPEMEIAYCAEQAAIERVAAEHTTLPMVRNRHLLSAAAWDKRVEMAKAVALRRSRIAVV